MKWSSYAASFALLFACVSASPLHSLLNPNQGADRGSPFALDDYHVSQIIRNLVTENNAAIHRLVEWFVNMYADVVQQGLGPQEIHAMLVESCEDRHMRYPTYWIPRFPQTSQSLDRFLLPYICKVFGIPGWETFPEGAPPPQSAPATAGNPAPAAAAAAAPAHAPAPTHPPSTTTTAKPEDKDKEDKDKDDDDDDDDDSDDSDDDDSDDDDDK